MNVNSKTIKELKEAIAFVVLLAPDRFAPDDRLNLESGFVEINSGIEYCKEMIDNEGAFEEIKKMSSDAERAYKNGDARSGAILLQKIRNMLTA
ncbi:MULTISPECIES: hypothetical protein [Asticcacaulis]|uniref:hypothetical protein n=1 Tax=Asticcacaulis TaxID=76890 RepID=UPI001AE13C1E|nr:MULTISPECIES: hypothetical protein [Asticcacaulis]MBP2159714.1 hypothetical protein [Asticcacaulis solisilvae]MDR6800459.1 hypothetical protein [Asticcacaulis sp. BE141]